MHRIAATAMLLLPLFAFAQRAKAPVFVPLKPPRVTRHTPVQQMEKGSVEGRTYKNGSIGLELKVADGLEFQAPELKGTPGTVPLLITVTAWRSEGLLSPRTATAFYADALAYYPETQRSTDAYMRKVIRGNRETGYEPVKENLKTDFGGMFNRFPGSAVRGCVSESVRSSSIRIHLRQFQQRQGGCARREYECES
jgi:hypothetical protein